MRFYQQLKNIYHYLQAHLWRAYYRWPDRGLKIYGVTGTNGKTTTCHLLASIFQEVYGSPKVGMLTTIAFWLGDEKIVNETKLTTLPSRRVFSYLAHMRQRGIAHVVVELTSHALDQHRLAGLQLDGAIILNIAREHLDYHQTMPAYAAAKEKIVDLLKTGAPLIGKADDDLVGPILTRARQRGVTVVEFTTQDATHATTALPGQVNQENALAASQLAQALGLSPDVVQRGVMRLTSVPGRMQWVTLATGTKAVIDYAVTPDALARLYQDLRQQATGKIFAVLGAAGRRDRGKRPAMAQVVAQYADELILTREDPWTESEEQIFQDLESGLQDATIPWQRIVDRTEALRYCISHATRADIIVATGKGAETGMGIGKKIIPWNETEVIKLLAAEVAQAKRKV